MTSPLRRGALAVLLLSPIVGCATVAPYEREALAMPEADVAEAEAGAEGFRAHVHESRRGSMAGGGAAGGGCGCN